MASIAKSFSTIIVSLVAAITASVTGYKEVKKLGHSGKVVKSQSSETGVEGAASRLTVGSGSGSGIGTITGTVQPSVPISLEAKYEMDANTVVLALALIVLPLIWYFDRKKKKNAQS